MGTRGKKRGKYSRTSRKVQLANKRARDRRYRAAKRQLAAQRENPDAYMHDGDFGPPASNPTVGGLHEAPSDTVDAAAEQEVDEAIARGELSPPQTVEETIESLRAVAGREPEGGGGHELGETHEAEPSQDDPASADAGDDGGNPVPMPPDDPSALTGGHPA